MFKIRLLSISFAALLLTGALPAQAIPMTTTNFGGYINIDNGNPFGFVFGDSIAGNASYDASALTGIALETAPLSSLMFTSLGFSFPPLPIFPPGLIGTFSSNQLIGIAFQGIIDPFTAPHLISMTGGPGFGIVNQAQTLVVGGCLDFGTGVCINPNVGTVPEPAPIALFAIGLLGFWASKRQKQGPPLNRSLCQAG